MNFQSIRSVEASCTKLNAFKQTRPVILVTSHFSPSNVLPQIDPDIYFWKKFSNFSLVTLNFNSSLLRWDWDLVFHKLKLNYCRTKSIMCTQVACLIWSITAASYPNFMLTSLNHSSIVSLLNLKAVIALIYKACFLNGWI